MLCLSLQWVGERLQGREVVRVKWELVQETICLLLKGLKHPRIKGVLAGEGEIFGSILEVPSEHALAKGVNGVSDLNAVIGGREGDRGGVGGTNQLLQGLPLFEGA